MPGALVDANVVLRVLTGEPEALADRATELLTAAADRKIGPVLAALTIAEIIYVLTGAYGWSRTETAERLLALFDTDVFTLLDGEAVIQALAWYRDIPGLDFPDAYLGALSRHGPNNAVISFDRHLLRLPGLRVISAAEDLL